MISNHFPSTYGNGLNWLVLAFLIVGSVAVRHYINMHEKGQNLVWMLPIGAVALLAAVIITAPKSASVSGETVGYEQVKPIFGQRCISCHAHQPTDDVYKAPPAGAVFETYEQCVNLKDKILNRAVHTRTMPQGNKTKITDEERELIGRWIEQGAKP